MANISGMCRNCGSLIMFDDRDSMCECVFCHCVFPSSEAVEILNNPEGREFPNEHFEPSADSNKHNTTRVFSADNIQKQIARDEVKRSKEESSPKNNEYEVKASDVKAPKKLVFAMTLAIAAFIVIVLAISIPMFNSRITLRADIESSINEVFDSVIEVDTTTDEEGKFYNGFSIFGQTCQYMNAATDDEVTQEDAKTLFENYCELRAQKMGRDSDIYDGVELKVYCSGGYYTVSETDGVINAAFTQDAEVTEE